MASAYDDAVKILARRAYSTRALGDRLRARGHDAASIDDALARLAAFRALDDAALARSVIATRGAHRGRERVLEELRRRGIDEDVSVEALRDAEQAGSRDDATALARAVRRRLGTAPQDVDRGRLARVYNALLSEGFEPAPLASALRPYGFRGDDE